MGVSSNYLYILYITADLQIMGLTHILLLVEVFSFLEANEIPNQRCVLNILSILPYPSTMSTVVESDGPDIIPAGYLALEMINKRSDILETIVWSSLMGRQDVVQQYLNFRKEF